MIPASFLAFNLTNSDGTSANLENCRKYYVLVTYCFTVVLKNKPDILKEILLLFAWRKSYHTVDCLKLITSNGLYIIYVVQRYLFVQDEKPLDTNYMYLIV